MDDVEDTAEQQANAEHLESAETPIQQAVAEVASGMRDATADSTLNIRVEALRQTLDDLSQEVYSWRGQNSSLEVIENLKQQVDEIQKEWNGVSEIMRLQRERLESLLQAFPGVIETSALRALSIRLSHLEEVVNQLVNEQQAKSTANSARKQLVISIVALVTSILLWGVFILMRFLPKA
jgi:polyhydroxyalkanoate synthesis regulator phasin